VFKDSTSKDAVSFEGAAQKIDDVPFGIVSDPSLVESSSDGSIFLFKHFDEGKAVFSGSVDTEEIVKFVKKNRLPLVVEFSQETAQKVFTGEIKKHVLMFISKKDDSFKAKNDEFAKSAAQFRNEFIFIMVNTDEEENSRVTEFFGLKKDNVPAIRLVVLDDDFSKYKPQEESFTESAISQFVNDFKSGKLKRHLMSETEPADWDSTSVKVLVSSTFWNRIAGKNAFVEFYAPWCGHCKQLAPIWDQLGDKFKDSADIVIAKVDATVNEIEGVKVSSFPTLKYFANGSTKETVINYSGERTLEELVRFVESGGKQAEPAAGEDEHGHDDGHDHDGDDGHDHDHEEL